MTQEHSPSMPPQLFPITPPAVDHLVTLDREPRQAEMAKFADAIIQAGTYTPEQERIITEAAADAGSFIGARRESDVAHGTRTYGLLEILANQ